MLEKTDKTTEHQDIVDRFPLDQWVAPKIHTQQVLNWLAKKLQLYFEETVKPQLDKSDKKIKLKIDERTVSTKKIFDFFNTKTLFKNGILNGDKSFPNLEETISFDSPLIKLSSLEPIEELSNCLAGISFDLAVKVKPRYAKDGETQVYPIKLQLVLQRFRKGTNIFIIKLRQANDSLKDAKVLRDRALQAQIWRYRENIIHALQNPASGGLPSLGKKR